MVFFRICTQRVHCQWGPYGDWSECDGCTKLQVSWCISLAPLVVLNTTQCFNRQYILPKRVSYLFSQKLSLNPTLCCYCTDKKPAHKRLRSVWRCTLQRRADRDPQLSNDERLPPRGWMWRQISLPIRYGGVIKHC